jgi:UDP-N-acetylglucosamine 2-epimerase
MEMERKEYNLKFMVIVGTRPEIIRLSRVMALLDQHVQLIIAHTGQNYDFELNEVFWNDLELRKPDFFMEVDTSSMGSAVGDILKKTEQLLIQERPDALLVLGDTNSCLSGYIAKRMHIPLFHMEAGNRSFDFNVPEEINRRIIDHISDFNLVYTEHARRHLIAEGLPHRRIYLTGSPMKEVLDFYQPKFLKSDILQKLKFHPKGYFVVSVHREENVDNPIHLENILEALRALYNRYHLPMLVSTHPRTRKRLEALNPNYEADYPFLIFSKPLGFIDYIALQMQSFCVISDSGTISEESAILKFPAISIRKSMERPEAQDSGVISLSGLEANTIVKSVEIAIEHINANVGWEVPEDYSILNTSWRVLKLMIGNARLSNEWWGVK